MGYVEELRAVVGHRPLILCGVKVFILDVGGRVLLHRKPNGLWAVPGGLMELGESAEDTGRREAEEETGLRLGAMQLLGVLSGAGQYAVLPNGDAFYGVTIVYACRDVTGGELRAEGKETVELRYFERDALPTEIPSALKALLPHDP
ncbi:NUDIX hydrolase [Cohnella caldifontis]|uniref:NUDIX hydrolase n=1 Tax=Cohnella caldifontis TaxID=3027471 RepID=UPI0023EB0A05|nr:NUDIX domain-containing protein [Cohnella sp. YIM B05605]